MGQQVDWYERRRELREGMVFRTAHGVIVQLDRTVPGDGTKWYAATWNNYTGGWSYEDYTIEPGDLTGEPANSVAALSTNEGGR